MYTRLDYQLLREFIREQAARIGGLGSRNIFTLDDSPITWDNLPGYSVDISPNVNGEYSLSIYFACHLILSTPAKRWYIQECQTIIDQLGKFGIFMLTAKGRQSVCSIF